MLVRVYDVRMNMSKFKACFMNDLYGIKGLGSESQKDKGQLFTVN